MHTNFTSIWKFRWDYIIRNYTQLLVHPAFFFPKLVGDIMPWQKIVLSLFYFRYRNSDRKWSQVLESMKINFWKFFYACKICKNVSWGPNCHGINIWKFFLCEIGHNENVEKINFEFSLIFILPNPYGEFRNSRNWKFSSAITKSFISHQGWNVLLRFPEWNWNQIFTTHYCLKDFLGRFSWNFWFFKSQQRI